MTTSHFIVSQRDNAWQVSFKGDITAPFATRDAAIAAAIEMASQARDTEAEVIVRDADLKSETVWRADSNKLTDRESATLADAIERERDA